MQQDAFDDKLFRAARQDVLYQQLLRQCREAEAEYRAILESLPPRQQEALERYITVSMELEHRLGQLGRSITE